MKNNQDKINAEDVNMSKDKDVAKTSQKTEAVKVSEKKSTKVVSKVSSKASQLAGVAKSKLPKKEVSALVQKTKKVLEKSFDTTGWEDGEFMDDVSQATLRGAHPAANLLFWVCVAFVTIFLFWSSVAEIDEVTHGEGKVIPSTRLQEVTHGEGGIVKGILVREGDVVRKDDPLILIDDTEFSSSLEERRARYYTLLAEEARLNHELSNIETRSEMIEYPEEAVNFSSSIILSQNNIYEARKLEFINSFSILEQQFKQKLQEEKEMEGRVGQTARAYELALRELEITKPLLKQGAISEVEILRLERTVNDLLGEKEAAELNLTKANFALEEARQRLEEGTSKWRRETLVTLGERQEELQRLGEVLKADRFRVDRTTVRSPVDASVNRVLVSTVGGVVGKGDVLVELIPLDDNLLVEAKVRPKDIAFLRPGQNAQVKITAYDFSIYGGLPAYVEHIGADTVADEKGNPFYHIRVRTEKNYLGKDDKKLPIIPGMVATVDILTGKKTVLDYLMKPFNKMRENALRER